MKDGLGIWLSCGWLALGGLSGFVGGVWFGERSTEKRLETERATKLDVCQASLEESGWELEKCQAESSETFGSLTECRRNSRHQDAEMCLEAKEELHHSHGRVVWALYKSACPNDKPPVSSLSVCQMRISLETSGKAEMSKDTPRQRAAYQSLSAAFAEAHRELRK